MYASFPNTFLLMWGPVKLMRHPAGIVSGPGNLEKCNYYTEYSPAREAMPSFHGIFATLLANLRHLGSCRMPCRSHGRFCYPRVLPGAAFYARPGQERYQLSVYPRSIILYGMFSIDGWIEKNHTRIGLVLPTVYADMGENRDFQHVL